MLLRLENDPDDTHRALIRDALAAKFEGEYIQLLLADRAITVGESEEPYRAALEERTRERVPLGWAMTQNNLAEALEVLGERTGDTARLEQAVAAYQQALLGFKHSPYYRDETLESLAKAQLALARHDPGSRGSR